MTITQTWTLTGLAALALVAGVLLATGAVGSAQEATPTATPSATTEPTDDPSTETPLASEDATDDATATPAPDSGDDSDDADNGDDTESDDTESQGATAGHWCGGGANPLIFDNAAEILGMTQDELRAAKQSGQSLADIAAAQGMTAEDFSAQLAAAAQADLQAQLSAGEITQEQFDEKSADLTEKLDDIVNSTGGAGFGHRGGPGTTDDGTTGGTRFRTPVESADAGTDA